MRSNIRAMNSRDEETERRRDEVRGTFTRRRAWIGLVFVSSLLAGGCAHVPNQFVEDSPASTGEMESDAARDLYARYQPAPPRERGWPQTVTAVQSGAVQHWPLYTQDPFEDKGTDRPDGPNKYYIGWEDYVALPYGFARFTLNWIALPVSLVVQPPWTIMESDGELSKQCLGYDHDPTEADGQTAPLAPASASSTTAPSGG
jgi:hypothetical protein